MIPEHRRGAASSSGNTSGRRYPKASGATAYSANPPSASQPVNVASRHRFSRPNRHMRHRPHVPRSQATPTRSPTAKRSAPGPRSTTVPTTSCPGTVCGRRGTRSWSARWRSVRHTPQTTTRSRTSPAPGRGTSRETDRSRGWAPRSEETTHARIPRESRWLALAPSSIRCPVSTQVTSTGKGPGPVELGPKCPSGWDPRPCGRSVTPRTLVPWTAHDARLPTCRGGTSFSGP